MSNDHRTWLSSLSVTSLVCLSSLSSLQSVSCAMHAVPLSLRLHWAPVWLSSSRCSVCQPTLELYLLYPIDTSLPAVSVLSRFVTDCFCGYARRHRGAMRERSGPCDPDSAQNRDIRDLSTPAEPNRRSVAKRCNMC